MAIAGTAVAIPNWDGCEGMGFGRWKEASEPSGSAAQTLALEGRTVG